MFKRFSAILLLLISSMSVYAQDKKKDEEPPYLKYPELPAFNILLMDSSSVFNTFNIPTGRYTVIMHFDPDCKHCKATMAELTAHMDSLQNIDFYLATPSKEYRFIRTFYSDYKLGSFANIKAVGCDYALFFMDYYQVHAFPDVALYGPDKKIIKLFDGHITVQELYDYSHK